MAKSVMAALNDLNETGKEKGYLTYGDLNNHLPNNITSKELERALCLLEEQGIELIDELKAEHKICPGCKTSKPLIAYYQKIRVRRSRSRRFGILRRKADYCATCIMEIIDKCPVCHEE